VSIASVVQTLTQTDPLFSSVTYPTDVEPWIALALPEVNATTFGVLYTNAIANLVAHKMAASFATAQAATGGAGGTPAELRAGKWSIRYQQAGQSAAQNSDSVLNETVYGREYLRLRGMCSGFPRVLSPMTI